MALQHDAQGFLAGDPIDIRRALSVWDDIGRDVKAIRAAIGRPTAQLANPANVAVKAANDAHIRPAVVPNEKKHADKAMQVLVSLKQGNAIASPRARDSLGRFVRVEKKPSADPAVKAVQEIASSKAKEKPVTPANRDKKGRFENDDKSSKTNQPNSEDVPSAESRTFLDRLTHAVTNTATGATGALEDADPAVKAVQEIAQPLSRGYKMLAGDGAEKKKEGWYRRIYATLTGLRKDEDKANKLTIRSLKNLEDKPVGGEEKTGFWSGLLKTILGIGPAIGAALLALLSKLPVIGKFFGSGAKVVGAEAAGAGAAAKVAAKGAAGVAGEAGVIAKGAGPVMKGFLKKLPLIGALFGAAGAASDIYSSETDDTLTRKEKDKNAGKATGGLAGTMAGGWAGASAGMAIGALGGPIGVAIGGMVGGAIGMFLGDQAGQIIGDTIGGWVGDLRKADIAGHITMAWDSVTGVIAGYWETAMGAWDTTVQAVSGAWDSVVKSFTSVADTIGKIWGDFVAKAKAGWDSFTGLFKSAYDGLKALPIIGPAIQMAEDATKKATTLVSTVSTKVADAAGSGASWVGKNTTVGKGAVALSGAAERAYNVTASTAGSALERVMPTGYRHKALFDGIKGGDSLQDNGSYTDAEAAKIRDLKTSNANTSANAKGGMSIEIQDKIAAQSKKAGVDPVMMQKIAAMESGGNSNAISSTGAIGIMQMTGKTASGLGIKDRFDADQNIEGGIKLAQQNMAELSSAKLPVTAENIYMMHQLGPKAAKEVISGAASGLAKSDMSAGTQKAMNLNYGAKSATAADYISTNKQALNDRYASATKNNSKAGVPAASDATTVAAATPVTPQASAVPNAPPMPATITTAQVQTAYAPAPKVPKFSPPPTIAEAPAVVNPLGTGTDSRQQVVIASASTDVGQDLKDRRIAHIVTGGMSA